MIKRSLFALLVMAACTKAGPTTDSPTEGPTSVPKVPGAAPKSASSVELTSVTLADDCGGTAPTSVPVQRKQGAKSRESEAEDQDRSARRRCEQTSMQLAIVAGAGASVKIKSVELFDDAGLSLGKLVASKPTKWADARSMYEAWDESVAAGSTLNVSYVLSQPQWDRIENRINRTYRLKTVITIGGVDQPAQKDFTINAPATLPPDVET